MYYASGTSIAQFPSEGIVISANLKNQGHEVMLGESLTASHIPILGMYETKPKMLPDTQGGSRGGRVALYGDSNCLDNSHLQKGYFSN